MDLSTLSLGSTTGIIASTMFALEILKRALGGESWYSKIPTFCYAIVISITLTIIANEYLHVLQGDVKNLIWQGVVSAASSGGLYTWLSNPESLGTTTKLTLTSSSSSSASILTDTIKVSNNVIVPQTQSSSTPVIDTQTQEVI